MKVQITLKNGVQIEFEADSITKKRSVTGELTELNWKHADDPMAPELFLVDLDQIAAIVTQRTGTSEQRADAEATS